MRDNWVKTINAGGKPSRANPNLCALRIPTNVVFTLLRINLDASWSSGPLKTMVHLPSPVSSPVLPFYSSSHEPPPPSCMSFIKAKVAQGLLMLQMVAQVITTLRLRNSLQQTKVIFSPLPHLTFSFHLTLSLSSKMLFSINQSSQLKLVFNFLPNPR